MAEVKPQNAYDRVQAADDINSPRFDPFRRPKKEVSTFHPLELIKMIFVGLFIFPFRLFWLLFWFLVYSTFLVIGVGKQAEEDLDKPPTKWRRFWVNGMVNLFTNFGFRLTEWFSFHLAFPFVQQYGDQSLVCAETGERANLIVANHSSYMDILLLMSNSDNVPGFVSKVEVLGIPLIGWYSRVWNSLYVDRSKGGQGVAEKIIERASDTRYPPILVFPEGTTTNGEYLIEFKRGAFLAGKPVKPVAIKYVYEKFSPTWECVKAPPHMLRLFTQVYNTCELHYLPVYVPNEDEKQDPDLYASNVRHAIAEVLGCQVSDSSIPEKIAYLKALRGSFDAR